MSKEKENHIYETFKNYGVILRKTEIKELCKVKKNHLNNVIGKLMTAKTKLQVKYTHEVPIDRRTASTLWAIWKQAQERYGKINGGQKYVLELYGRHLYAIRSLSHMLYEMLREQNIKE